MGRKPCYNAKDGLNKGPWTEDEDLRLVQFIEAHGEGRWPALAKNAGLKRCGKSCRLRWVNYLRPNLKRGNISPDEEDLIIRLHKLLGNRWALIAGRIPGRTDNEIKNYWNTHLNKKAHGNQCIGQLKSVRATQTANVKEPAVSMTPSLNTFNQLGERDELVIASRVIEELKKGSTSSNSIVSGKEGKILISPTKQNPSSSSDAGTLSEEMKLWNPLQLNFILSSSWANSNFLHNDDSSVDKSVGYNEENAGHARPVQSSVDKAVSYNEENARPVQSCMFDAVNVCQDYFDQMFSIPHCSVPFPEVVPTTAATIDEFANFFNFFPYPY